MLNDISIFSTPVLLDLKRSIEISLSVLYLRGTP